MSPSLHSPRKKFFGLGGLALCTALSQAPARAVAAPSSHPHHASSAAAPKKAGHKKEAPDPNDPFHGTVKADAVLLYDETSHQILYERHPDAAYPPASTTKLMTALLVYEKTGPALQGEIRIAPEDLHLAAGNHIPLKAGETVSVDALLHALLISSDNNAAMALARFVSGSVPEFVKRMNERARELGCTDTEFANPHGLGAPGIHTTADDLFKIFNQAVSIPTLREIMRTPQYKIFTAAHGSHPVTLHHHNLLLAGVSDKKHPSPAPYPGMDAAKTGLYKNGGPGYEAALGTYAADVIQHGRELRLILLHSSDKFGDAPKILNYGFAKAPLPVAAAPQAPVKTEEAPRPKADAPQNRGVPWIDPSAFADCQRPFPEPSSPWPASIPLPAALPCRKEY